MARKRLPAPRVRRREVLILCEGHETEPNYLGAVVRLYSLTAVTIPRNHITDPMQLVQLALSELKRNSGLHAWVVFDRDTHVNFAAAVGLARGHPLFNNRLWIVRSYPCFEVWLLHHFQPQRAPLTPDQAIQRLKQHANDYDKGDAACMDQFMERRATALKNSEAAEADAAKTGSSNSSTEMHKLLHYLKALADKED